MTHEPLEPQLPDTQVPSPDLLRNIESTILTRAQGKIRRLQVVEREGLIVLLGHTGTHYSKQMALHAAIDIAHPSYQIQNEIEVGV